MSKQTTNQTNKIESFLDMIDWFESDQALKWFHADQGLAI